MLALVNGNFRFQREARTPRSGGGFFPLGLLSLAAYAGAESDREVEVLNPPPLVCRPGEEVSAVARYLEAIEAPVLGLSVTALTLPLVLAGLRRRPRNGQRVMIGGPGLIGVPPTLLDDFPEVDVLIHGEGERPLIEALKRFSGQDVPIPGASYRRDSEVVRPLPPTRLPSLDLIPPVSYSDLGPGPKRVVTESSRGCPFKCIFCSSPVAWGNRVTTRSAERIVDELGRLADEHGPLQVIFVDDLFTLSRKRVLKLCRAMRDADLPIRWVCFGRIETVDETVLENMRDAGCQAISFGVEAGSDRVLRRLGKNFSARRARRVISAAGSILPMVEASFIRGFPFESLAEFQESLDLMEHCHQVGGHAKLYTLTPLLGTPLTSEFERNWRFDPAYSNPSLEEWFPVSGELVELFERFPYLAWPYGYFDYPERLVKEAMSPSWAERDHTLAGREARTAGAGSV